MTRKSFNLIKHCDTMMTPLARQVLAALACSYLSTCSGLTLGYSSVLLPQLSADSDINLDSEIVALIASISALAMGLGGVCGGFAIDRWGRRIGMAAMSVPGSVGWVLLATASNSIGILAARALTGLSSGALRGCCVVYLAEITPPCRRSLLLPSPSCAAILGVMLSHAIGTFIPWRTTAILFTVVNLGATVVAILLSESPLWLILNGEIEQGTKLFLALRGDDNAAKVELSVAIEKRNARVDEGRSKMCHLVCSAAFLRPAVVCFIMFVCAQWSGVNIYFFLSHEFCNDTCPGGLKPFPFLMVVDGVRFLMSVAVCFMAKMFPRRLTFLWSCVGTAVACGLMAIGEEVRKSVWGAVGVAVHEALGSVLVALAWSFSGEIFPAQVRGIGSASAGFSTFFLLFVLVQSTPSLTAAISVVGLYTLYAIFLFGGAFILYFILPDTDHKTLQEIEDEYQSNQK